MIIMFSDRIFELPAELYGKFIEEGRIFLFCASNGLISFTI